MKETKMANCLECKNRVERYRQYYCGLTKKTKNTWKGTTDDYEICRYVNKNGNCHNFVQEITIKHYVNQFFKRNK